MKSVVCGEYGDSKAALITVPKSEIALIQQRAE
jgi:hypothetical protein